MVIEILFPQQAVAAQRESMIGNINHYRSLFLPGLTQRSKYPADTRVVMRDHSVVVREMFPHDVG